VKKYRVVFSLGGKEYGFEVQADSLEKAKGIAWDAAKEVANKTGRAYQLVRIIALNGA
jgi:hypothetical protein